MKKANWRVSLPNLAPNLRSLSSPMAQVFKCHIPKYQLVWINKLQIYFRVLWGSLASEILFWFDFLHSYNLNFKGHTNISRQYKYNICTNKKLRFMFFGQLKRVNSEDNLRNFNEYSYLYSYFLKAQHCRKTSQEELLSTDKLINSIRAVRVNCMWRRLKQY